MYVSQNLGHYLLFTVVLIDTNLSLKYITGAENTISAAAFVRNFPANGL